MGHYGSRKLNRIAAGAREPRGFRQHLEGCDKCRASLDLALAARWARMQGSPQETSPTDHLTLPDMLRMAEGRVSKRKVHRAVAHLAHCEPCRFQIAGLAQAGTALDADDAVQPRAGDLRAARELWRAADPDAPLRVSPDNPMTLCLLADDSRSMAGAAAAEITEAIRDFVTSLQAACGNRGSYFRLLLIKFGDYARVVCDSVPLLEVDPRRIELTGASGGTDIAGALQEARLRLWPSAGTIAAVPPLVLLYTDGQATGPDPVPVAEQIKSATFPADRPPLLVTCGFGEADEDVLKRVATTPGHYLRLASPAAFHRLLAAVGGSVTSVTTEPCTVTTLWRDIGRSIAAAA